MEPFDQSSILRDIENVLKKDVKQRLPELKKLSGRTKKMENAFLSKVVDGLLDYYDAYDQVQSYGISRRMWSSEEQDSLFDVETQVRENAIGKFKGCIMSLGQASRLASESTALESERSKIVGIIDLHIYRATILSKRQHLVLCMNNLEYDEARRTAQEGLECARRRSEKGEVVPPDVKVDINFFAGNLKEIDAFEKISNKKFWEVRSADFREAAKSFEDAASCLERAAYTQTDKDKLISVPKAWSYLSRFISNPSLTNFSPLIEFRKLESVSQAVKTSFAIREPSDVSKRKQRSVRMAQFMRSNVIKIACWNIFSEIRYNLNRIETSANENIRALERHFEEKKMEPKRLERYKPKPDRPEQEPEVTSDRFIEDLEKYSPELLPTTVGKKERPSIVVANDIYHFCKHEKMQMDFYSATVDKFSTDFIERVVKEFNTLQKLSVDTEGLLKRLNSLDS